MRRIECSQCGKPLFKTEKVSDGAAGAEAQRLGFIFKMPFLYTNTSECLFFCTKECTKEYYKKNIPSNPDSDKLLKDFKEKIPEMSKELGKGLQDFADKLKVKLNKEFRP